MFKFKTLILLSSLALLSSITHATTQEQIDAATRLADTLRSQEQQRLDEQQRQLERSKAPSGLDLDAYKAPTSLPNASSDTCFEFKRLSISGAEVLDEWDLEALEAPFLGKCITAELAVSVLESVTDYYLSRGFITTRAYLPNQDLKQGTMRVLVAEGLVEKTVVKGQKPIELGSVYQPDVDLALNIRDLEQAVDQLNAVPGNDVAMAIKPGETPQKSQVIFENKGQPAVEGQVLIDNAGSEATGKYGASLSVLTGNLTGLNDTWSWGFRKSFNAPPRTGSSSGRLDIKVPHGYNTYGLGYSSGGFDTLLTFPVTGVDVSNAGDNTSAYLSASRVIFRNQNTKHSLSLKLQRDSVKSHIADIKIDVSSRSLNGLFLSSESIFGFGKNVLIVSPELAMGLNEVDNLPEGANTPRENPQAEYLRYKLTLDWMQPFEWNEYAFQWKSRLVGQHADMPLYGSEKIVVGGAGSVRGSHFTSISGDRGYFLQNSITLKREHSLGKTALKGEYMLGYDVGHVWSENPDAYEGGMQAAVVGASWRVASWNLSLQHSIPIDVDGELDKGDAFTTLSIGLAF